MSLIEFALRAKKYWQASQIRLPRVRRNFVRTLCFANHLSSEFFCGPLAKIFCQCVQNCLQCVPEKFKSNEFSLENFKLFLNVWILREKWRSSERKIFGRFDKNCVSPLSRTILKRISERRNWNFFSKFVGKKFRWIAKIFRRKMLRLHFTTFEKMWEKKYSFWNIKNF